MVTKVLIIDDLRISDRDNKDWYPDQDVEITYARNSAAGLFQLTHEEWDEVWLDHDLGIDDTIMPVVDWMCERAFDGYPIAGKVFVHTANPPAGDTMVKSLARYGYDPIRKYGVR